MPPGTDLTYTWSQAQADLGQIAPIVALTGFFLLAMVLASATSLVTVFLGLEMLSIALYIMCGFARTDFRSQEAAAKYLLVGGFASAFVLYGMALVYGASGTTVIPDIAQRLAASAGM